MNITKSIIARLLALAAVASTSAAEPQDKTPAQTGQAARWGYVGALASPGSPEAVIAPTSDIGKLPYAQVYATARCRVLHYRFPVPDGTYKVRVHFLQAAGGTTKNNVGLSVVANGMKIVDNLEIYVAGNPGGPPRKVELPADIVAKTSEAEVASKNGQIMVSFPVTTKPNWGVCGVEVIGKQATIRVNCGAKAAYTDAAGHVWESDVDRRLPLTSGEISLDKRELPKGQWVNISDEIAQKLSDELGLVQVSVWPYFFGARGGWVVCDRSGNTFIGFQGLGLWQYDLRGGTFRKADEGKYTAEAENFCMDQNPDGPGFYLMGWSAQHLESYAVRCLDGKGIETIAGGGGHNGWDNFAVDWTANPPVVFVKVHHTPGNTALSVDGGKTFKDPIAEDGKNFMSLGALGNGVLVKCMQDGTIMRITDLGVTWAKTAQITLGKKLNEYRSAMTRIGKNAYFNTGAGVYVSKDAGVTWNLIPDSPVVTQKLVAGKNAGQLLGFGGDKAYESLDEGLTWKMAIEKKGVQEWNYDPAGDVFYAKAAGSLYRYAR